MTLNSYSKTYFVVLMCQILMLHSLLKPRLLKIPYSTSTQLYLNRIFADLNELSKIDDEFILELDINDYRSDHIMKILKLNEGDKLRVGVLNKGITDDAYISQLPSIKTNKQVKEDNKDFIPTSNNSSNTMINDTLSSDNNLSNKNTMKINFGTLTTLQKTSSPQISLILSAPRPLRLERLLPIISCMGVKQLMIIGATKVPKDYFGIQLLQKPALLNSKLIEGLEQAEVDCHLPTVSIHPKFNKFIKYELNHLFPIYSSFNKSTTTVNDSNNNNNNNNGSSSSSRTGDRDNIQSSSIYNKNTISKDRNTNTNPNYIKIVLQPRFPIMTKTIEMDGVNVTKTLPTPIRLTELFLQYFISKTTSEQTDLTHSSTTTSSSDRKSSNTQPWAQMSSISSSTITISNSPSTPYEVILAVGPEGGWTYEELESWISNGFHLVHMDDRILRTDIAVQKALGITSELLAYFQPKQ